MSEDFYQKEQEINKLQEQNSLLEKEKDQINLEITHLKTAFTEQKTDFQTAQDGLQQTITKLEDKNNELTQTKQDVNLYLQSI